MIRGDTVRLNKHRRLYSALGVGLAVFFSLLPNLLPPLFPPTLSRAVWIGALLAGLSAVFAMRWHSRFAWRLLAYAAPVLVLLYFFRVETIDTGRGPIAVPVGLWWRKADCCDDLSNAACLLRRTLTNEDLFDCWGEYSVKALRVSLAFSYWATALASGALIGLYLLKPPASGVEPPGRQVKPPPKEKPAGTAPPFGIPELAYDLFLSYSNKDEAFVERLANDLRSRNLRVWWDQLKVAAGDSIDARIQEGLRTSRGFAVVLSPNAVSSEWVLEEIEAARAVARKRRKQGVSFFLIPILYQECDIPEFLLGKLHVDFTLSYDQGLEDLLRALQPTVAGGDQSGKPAPPEIMAAELVTRRGPERKRSEGVFDVFLCYNSADKPEVKKIGEQLKERGILPWLDVWELQPGKPWQRLLEEQIRNIKSAAVFVGSAGLGPWQHQELDGFLRMFVARQSPVIPVLLPNAPEKPELPLFLANMTWVDFRVRDPDPLDHLIFGVTGKWPERLGE